MGVSPAIGEAVVGVSPAVGEPVGVYNTEGGDCVQENDFVLY